MYESTFSGREISAYFFQGLNWLVAFTDPVETWNNEPTFLLIQLSVIFGVFLNYIHGELMSSMSVHIRVNKDIYLFSLMLFEDYMCMRLATMNYLLHLYLIFHF